MQLVLFYEILLQMHAVQSCLTVFEQILTKFPIKLNQIFVTEEKR